MSSLRIDVTANVQGAVTGLDQVRKSTQRTGAAIENATSKMGRMNNQVTTAQKNFRKFAMGGAQQAGYQIGDYAVQVANGTSKMQAFGQQMPQLLQIFGPIGAVVGAGVAIFAAFAVVMQRTKDAAKGAEVEVVSLGAAFDSLKKINGASIGDNLSAPAKAATAEYSILLESMRKVAEQQRVAAISSIVEEIAPAKAISDLYTRFNEISRIRRSIYDQGKREGNAEYDRALQSQKDILAELSKERQVRDVILSIGGATRAEATKNLAAAMTSLETSGSLSDELRVQLTAYGDQIGQLAVIEKIIADVDATTADAAESASDFANAMQQAAAAVMNINVNAFAKLKSLQAELRGRTRGLGDSEIRIMQAARAAEIEAQKSGVDSSAELAAIAAEAAAIERNIIAAEGALAEFNVTTVTASAPLRKVADIIKQEVTPAMERLKSVQESVSSAIESGMMGMVDGTQSVKEAFKSMASAIIKDLYRIFVVKKITGFISDAIGAKFGSSAPTSSIRPVARSFAGGGYTGDGARAGGLDGKGGYMAMIHPRETVVDHTKGGSTGGVTIIQNNTFGNGVNRAEINAMLPKIVEASKAAVLDARRRGGSYAGAF